MCVLCGALKFNGAMWGGFNPIGNIENKFAAAEAADAAATAAEADDGITVEVEVLALRETEFP